MIATGAGPSDLLEAPPEVVDAIWHRLTGRTPASSGRSRRRRSTPSSRRARLAGRLGQLAGGKRR